ncbi:hypothetical protein PG616_01000 [Riemerella anatipestifer]|nr:hypothetical protein [Riemerella anatipestifer]
MAVNLVENKSKNKIFKPIGASSHTSNVRQENDFYATSPKASELLLEFEDINHNIIDNSIGAGHLMQPFIQKGYNVKGFDIVDRGYPNTIIGDFLEYTPTKKVTADIICNPPYKLAQEFIEHSLDIIEEGYKVCAFLKVLFLEGKKRKKLFEAQPPKIVYVSSSRILCAKNAMFEDMEKGGGSAVAYAWFVWHKGYKGDTIVKWIN